MAICIKLRHLLTCRREYKAVHGPCGIPSDPPGVNKSTPVTYGQLELPLAGNPSKHKEFDSTALLQSGLSSGPLGFDLGIPSHPSGQMSLYHDIYIQAAYIRW